MAFAGDYARRVLRKLDEDIASAVSQVAGGLPANEQEYRRLVGWIAGLRRAREHFLEPLNPQERAELSHQL